MYSGMSYVSFTSLARGDLRMETIEFPSRTRSQLVKRSSVD